MVDPGTGIVTASKVASTAPFLIQFALRYQAKEIFKSGSRALDAAIAISNDSKPSAMTRCEKQAQLELVNNIDQLSNS